MKVPGDSTVCQSSEGHVPFIPTAQTTTTVKKTTNYKCMCDWGDTYDEYHSIFLNKLNDEDPWKGNHYQHRSRKKYHHKISVRLFSI